MQLKNINAIRWFARAVGAALLVIAVLFIIGEGMPGFADLNQNELLLFGAMLLMMTGLILAFKWELPGGLSTVSGYILFVVVEGDILSGPIFPAFFVVGVLYIIYWWSFRKFNTFN